MNRRAFLTACIAVIPAPAIVRASSLMPVKPREPGGWWIANCAPHVQPVFPGVVVFDYETGTWKVLRF